MKDYQCVYDVSFKLWHLTQRQADPPSKTEPWCWTSCYVVAIPKHGYEKRRPTCEECLGHVTKFERTGEAGKTPEQINRENGLGFQGAKQYKMVPPGELASVASELWLGGVEDQLDALFVGRTSRRARLARRR